MFGWFRRPKVIEVVISGSLHIHVDDKLDGSSISEGSRAQVCEDSTRVQGTEARAERSSKDGDRKSSRSILPSSIGDGLELPEVEFGEEVK